MNRIAQGGVIVHFLRAANEIDSYRISGARIQIFGFDYAIAGSVYRKDATQNSNQ